MRRRGAARLPGQKTACLTPRKEDGFCPPNLETRVRRAAEFKRNTRPSPVLRRDVVWIVAIGKAVAEGLGTSGKKTAKGTP